MDHSRFLRGPSTLKNFDDDDDESPIPRPGSRQGSAQVNSRPSTVDSKQKERQRSGHDSIPDNGFDKNNRAYSTGMQPPSKEDSNPARGYDHDSIQKSKDAVNKDILHTVRKTFMDADNDGSGKLAPSEFIRAFTGILQTEDGADADALSKLFCRIDANCDGTIDWDEFSSYMLLESAGSASIRELETAIDLLPPVSHFVPEQHLHTDLITHLSRVQMSNGTDRYVTCGKDGLVKIWNCKDLKHMRSINTGKSWVTCAKMLPNSFKLAVASFSRSMKIYDLNTYELCGQIQEIDYAPMAMDVWLPRLSKDAEMVVFGDGGGFVRLYQLRINPLEDKNSSDRYLDTPMWKHQHHSDWVTCVRYVEDLNCVVAGSLDKLVSITDAEERVPLKVLDGHTKGVTSVDWSPLYKFVCSGGQDRKIILWNPFSQRPLAQLTGHATSVQQVMVNDKDNQIISLGSDKVVKVWDIRNHKCLQTLQDREQYKLDNTLLSMSFDQRRKVLLTGNLHVKTWQQVVTTSSSSGHRDPVTKVLYNPLFQEAVSGDHVGTVSVWYVMTGKLRFRFYNAHGTRRITAMTFDIANRRLLTGADNGEAKVWNFSSGACITQLKPNLGSQQEVTSIMAVRGSLTKSFLVAGWDRKVTFYEDSGLREVAPGRCLKGHESDVLDMALMEKYPSLCTACDDGSIWIWNLDSGAPRLKLVPDDIEENAVNERAVEAVKFLHGNMRHILVAVYADRFLRLWDVHAGSCLLEVFTGHKLGETVMSVAVDSLDQRVATADSAGYMKIWNSSNFAASLSGPVSGNFVEVCVWRGHKVQVTSLDWVELPDRKGRFLLSSSRDKEVKLWSDEGVLVGTFGIGAWQLEDPSTWKETVILAMESTELHDMEMSRRQPNVVLQANMGRQYSFMREDDGRPATAPHAVARVLQASLKQRMARVESVHVADRLASSRSRAASSVNSDGGLTERSTEASKTEQDDPDEDDAYESDSSNGHDSDGDVPGALWLEEFDAARKARLNMGIPGQRPVSSVGGRNMYQPPKGVSELSKLPDRPNTSSRKGT